MEDSRFFDIKDKVIRDSIEDINSRLNDELGVSGEIKLFASICPTGYTRVSGPQVLSTPIAGAVWCMRN